MGVLVGVQVAAILIYLAVERSRDAPAPTFEAQRLSNTELAATITGNRSDGSELVIAWPSQRTRLVHFWATWCKPCREELPGLIAFARNMRERGVDVVAIAVEDDWKDIRAFFGGTIPPEVIVETNGAARMRFGVSTLPDTYLVDQAGRLIERFHGARDWRASSAREHVLGRIK